MKILSLSTLLLIISPVFAQERLLTNNSAEDRYASYSPDGSSIIFESNRNGNWDVFLMDNNGENQRALTSHSGEDRRPTWHPSGNRILFESERSGSNQLYELTLENNKVQKISIEYEGLNPIFAKYSPNGQQIAFSAGREEEHPNIYVADLSGENLTAITAFSFRTLYPDWSPDGNQFVFFSRHETENTDDEIYTSNIDGTEIQRLTNWPKHNFCPRWSADGTRIAYVTSMEGSRPEIYVMDANGENQKRITNNEDGDTLPNWSSDGTKLLVTGYRNGNYEICEITLSK